MHISVSEARAREVNTPNNNNVVQWISVLVNTYYTGMYMDKYL